jgi:biopolymer transport protein ExbD
MHPTAKHASVDVSVTPNGRIFVGDRLVDESTVYGALAAIARRDRSTTVDLTGDAHAPYGLVVLTLDAAKAAGLENVTFVTR